MTRVSAVGGRCTLPSLLLLMATLFTGASPVPAGESMSHRSPFDVRFSPDGRRLAVSDATAGLVYCLDVPRGGVEWTARLRGKPRGVAWASPDRILAARPMISGSAPKSCTDKGRSLATVFRRATVERFP